MKIEIRYVSQTHSIELENDQILTVGDLREAVYAACRVLPKDQKLLGKPKLGQNTEDSVSLLSIGFKTDTVNRLMLIGSTVAEKTQALQASDALANPRVSATKRLLRKVRGYFWSLGCYRGLLADAYGMEREMGENNSNLHLITTIVALDGLLERLNPLGPLMEYSDENGHSLSYTEAIRGGRDAAEVSLSSRLLEPLLDNSSYHKSFRLAHGVLRRCALFMGKAGEAISPAEVLEVVEGCISELEHLSPKSWVMLPGGWRGRSADNVFFLLITRESRDERFTMVVVNRGNEGSVYHRRWPTAEKLKICPLLTFEHIEKEKMLDKCFWLVLLSLWIRRNNPHDQSEYIREEVFYDVLLAWLVERSPSSSTSAEGASLPQGGEGLRSVLGVLDDVPGNWLEGSIAVNGDSSLTSAKGRGDRGAGRAGTSSSAVLLATNPSLLQPYRTYLEQCGCTPPRRAESSTVKSALTALCWLMCEFSEEQLTAKEVKQVKFAVKLEGYRYAAQDLVRIGRLLVPEENFFAYGFSTTSENTRKTRITNSNKVQNNDKEKTASDTKHTVPSTNTSTSGFCAEVSRNGKTFVWEGTGGRDSSGTTESGLPKLLSSGVIEARPGSNTLVHDDKEEEVVKVDVLKNALEKLEALGVKDLSKSGLHISELWSCLEEEGILIKSATGKSVSKEAFTNKIVLVYFAMYDSYGVPQFSELLGNATPHLMDSSRRGTHATELLFVSIDKDVEAYNKHAEMLPFHRLSFPASSCAHHLDVVRACELLLFSPSGTLIHREGVASLRADPLASTFPFGSCWRGVLPLCFTDQNLIRMGTSVMAHHTTKGLRHGIVSARVSEQILELLDAVQDVLKELPRDQVISMYNTTPKGEYEGSSITASSQKGKEGKENTVRSDTENKENGFSTFLGSSNLRNALSKTLTVSECGQGNANLLSLRSTFFYLGKPYGVSIPYLPPVYQCEVATSFKSLHDRLQLAAKTVDALWKRAGHSSTSSRVAEQMHIIEFITWVVSQKIPVPAHPSGFSRMQDAEEEKKVSSSFYFEDTFSSLCDRVEGEDSESRTNQEGGNRSSPPLASGSRTAAAQQGQQGRDMQFEILNSLFYLTISLTNAWQAVETPTRGFDAERTLIAIHILVVFDAVARQRAGSIRCQLLSNLLNFEGGYYPSTTMSINNIPFEILSASLELTRPQFLPIRSAIISYIAYLQRTFAYELYDFPMPSNSLLEVNRESHSIYFLRTFMDNAGISLPEESSAQNMTEMEKLMDFFCSPESALHLRFSEFTFLRDMVFLTKFLGTMETREAHLLHRRKALNRFAHWRLSFEESTPGWQMSAGWRTTPTPPKWECVLVRGRFMNIADIRVIGFGDRELHYGEGMMIVSPIDVGRLMDVPNPTEDDILHARLLPTFGGSLNQEEAEMLLSFLTTPYLRIPLLLDFFSSGDRSSHLFVKEVQDVLRAALFEPGTYSARLASLFTLPTSEITIPLLRPSQEPGSFSVMQETPWSLREEGVEGGVVLEEVGKSGLVLGTTYGLLLNELLRDPHPVLEPLWQLLQKTSAIGSSSVYSIHTSYIFFIIELICDVLGYASFALSMTSALPPASKDAIEEDKSKILVFLERVAYPWFLSWTRESEENDDTPTQCVVLNGRSMVDRILWKSVSEKLGRLRGISPLAAGPAIVSLPSAGELENGSGATEEEQEEGFVRERACRHLFHMLQSCAFVRAHHGFGMGLQRTQLSRQHGDAVLTPEENLVRFLQSQGLHIPSMVQSSDLLASVQKLMMCGGRRRAVFLQISSANYKDTVRLPNLFRHSPQSTQDARNLKLPPCDVAENRVFFILLDSYHSISTYIRSLSPTALNAMMEEVVQTVLRHSHKPHYHANGNGSNLQNSEGQGNSATSTTTNNIRSISYPSSGSIIPSIATINTYTTTTRLASTSSPSWTLAQSADVITGPPFSGLIFHFRSGELFWRQKELKPVPDSMSHFSDYEVILGKELRQCGEVLRHQSRHWVQVVGTPYDLMEWTAPNIKDNECGEGCPRIMAGEWPTEMVKSAMWEGILYDRVVAVGEGQGQEPWPVKREEWAIKMVRMWMETTIRDIRVFPLAPSLESMNESSFFSSLDGYPSPIAPGRTGNESTQEGNGERLMEEKRNEEGSDNKVEGGNDGKMQVKGSEEGVVDDLGKMQFIFNDAPQFPTQLTRATWKELVAYKYPEPYLEVYNLVPHGRCMYRSLIFSSNQKLSFHSLPPLPMTWRDRKDIRSKAFAAGIPTDRIYCESSLEIHRYNELLKGREKYLSPRLLQGVFPGVLLEAFAFWIGEDNIIRGYADDAQKKRASKDGRKMDSFIEVEKLVKSTRSLPSQTSPSSRLLSEKGERVGAQQDNAQDDHQANGEPLDQWHHFSIEIFLQGGKAFIVRRNDLHYTPIFDYLPYHHHLHGRKTAPTDTVECDHKTEEEKGIQTATTTMDDGGKGMAVDRSAADIPDSFTPDWERSIALLRAAIHQPHEVCLTILNKFDGDAHQALQWALDASNAAFVEQLREESRKSSSSSTTGATRAGRSSTSLSKRIRPGVDLMLVSIHSCRHLHQFFSLLTGLEDASHTLVWARQLTALEENQKAALSPFLVSLPSEVGTKEECSLCIESVELPRLRARFLLQHEGGVSSAPLHLFLADYPGWRLAEMNDLHPAALSKLSILRESFQQSILLCNSIHEIAVMVPNHSFTPLKIANDPLNPFLIFDRGNFSWQEAVSSPFYLYTLHSSGCIVVPQTLSASLYLAALQCGTQHYAEATATLEACYTDTSFTHEESYMYDLFQFTKDDTSPDATAVRLKAAHALQYSPNKYEWLKLDVELNRYIETIAHVSSDCRLTFHELLDLIKRCERPSTLVQAQLKIHHARVKQWPETSTIPLPSFSELPAEGKMTHVEVQNNHRLDDGSDTTMTMMTIPSVPPIGLCWDRLLLQPWGRIVPQKLHRVAFMNPTVLNSTTGVVDFLWKDLLLSDEESGANAHLGFFFLYNVELGTIPIKVGVDDCTKSFAAIMGRWFHLRHAQWGREHSETGEGVRGPSWCAVVLQLMRLAPRAGWPSCNLLRESFPLRHGVHLGPAVLDDFHSRGRPPSTIPQMFKDIEKIADECFHTACNDYVVSQNEEEQASSLLQEPESISTLQQWRAHRQHRLFQLTSKEYVVRFPISKHLSLPFHGSLRHRNNAQSVVKTWSSSSLEANGVATKKAPSILGFGEGSPAHTLFALCHQPLLEVPEVKKLLLPFSISSSTEEEVESSTLNRASDANAEMGPSKKEDEEAEEASMDALPSLPFDLRDHPLAGSAIAQGMLQRLEKDFRFYTAQQRVEAESQGQKNNSDASYGENRPSRASLSCLAPDVVHTILFSSDSTAIAQAFSCSLQTLEAATEALRQLQAKDQEAVSLLTSTILRTANALTSPPPLPSTHASTASDGMPASSASNVKKKNAIARQRELDEVPTTDPQWVQHRLLLYHRDRVPLRMEWLCGGLLSTELEQEIKEQNPYHGDVAQLRCYIVLLMLRSNRSYLAMQALASIQQVILFLQLCRLLRGIPDEVVHVDAGVQLASIPQRTRELYILFALEVSPAALETLLSRCGEYVAMLEKNKNAAVEVPQLPEEVGKLLYNRLWHLGDSVRGLLSAQRFFIEECGKQNGEGGTGALCGEDGDGVLCPSTTCYTLDPRFLMMEFLFNILLRRRQVEMTRWFMQELHAGRSRVQQMIMGQGKTSVVAPLLTLMLADGRQLVTQVMPTALVEQTRAVLRRCFGVVMVKHVFTLQFDRTRGDEGSTGSWEVEALLTKLQSAVTDRAVVVAAPESLKSLFLKYIEQLHLLESTVPFEPISQDAREIALATRAEERAKARARVVDAIAPILALWRDGVLLMDEVDVLLHPLRSELNFPIGEKDSIDMCGPRWGLPVHLLDLLSSFRPSRGTKSTSSAEDASSGEVALSYWSLFSERYYQRSHTKRMKSLQYQRSLYAKEDEERDHEEPSRNPFSALPVNMEAEEDLSGYYREVVHSFHRVLMKGVRHHFLQREPHLVLLDSNFYEEEMLPLWITWAQLWVLEELQEYLYKQVLPCRAPWDRFESMRAATHSFFYNSDRLNAANEREVSKLLEVTPVYGIKLLNLAHDWLHRLLPHVLGKINRVNFGLLQPSDLQRFSQQIIDVMPISRKLTAVPFVAKDVPSTSSEFAHPDVAIGLTILAFCYEGLRLGDTKRLLQELKKDFSQQLGPKDVRPAVLLYQEWIRRSLEVSGPTAKEEEGPPSNAGQRVATEDVESEHSVLKEKNTSSLSLSSSSYRPSQPLPSASPSASIAAPTSGEIVPLSQLQVTDTYQLNSLHQLLHRVPDVVYYYLTSLVFPRTMLFHRLKVSACGHELGSSMLFGRRLGFSGTPSDLLPLDLGACEYEVGSDARVLSVLTDPEVVRVEVLEEDWTPLRVLDRIAAAQPPFYALIDAGALITNMNNPDVATYLLGRLPSYLFDGVVYLDERDEQMVQQRQNGIAVPVAQCGIPVSRRFVFFDQVHTTGTDVKQSASASAVMTLGKDLTFRDYAQGAYRMRGIGNGQKLCLYLIPEVMARMKAMLCPSSVEMSKNGASTKRTERSVGHMKEGEEAESELARSGEGVRATAIAYRSTSTPTTRTFETGNLLLDTPAWLMLNSMKMESLQYLKLSLQEFSNVWRKRAYYYFLADCLYAVRHREIFTAQRRAAMFRVKRIETDVEDAGPAAKRKKMDQCGRSHTWSLPLPSLAQMRMAMEEFREAVGYPVSTTFEAPRPFQSHVEELLAHRPGLFSNDVPTGEPEKEKVEEESWNGTKTSRTGMDAEAIPQDAVTAEGGELREVAAEYYQRPSELGVEEVIAKVMERLRFFLHNGVNGMEVEENEKEGGKGSRSISRLAAVVSSPTHTDHAFTNLSLNAEMVHEQEAEEQQEEEAEEEEQRVMFYSRDDEKVLPWRLNSLQHCGIDESSTMSLSHGSCFYQLRCFSAQRQPPGQMLHQLDPHYLLSDNYFRLEWSGLGERRLKNAVLFMEWTPFPLTLSMAQRRHTGKSKGTTGASSKGLCMPSEEHHKKKGSSSGSTPHDSSKNDPKTEETTPDASNAPSTCFGLLSLIEAESIRWLVHHSQDQQGPLRLMSPTHALPPSADAKDGGMQSLSVAPHSLLKSIALRLVRTGRSIASTAERPLEMCRPPSATVREQEENVEEKGSSTLLQKGSTPAVKNEATTAALLFRFVNNDMFFTDEELEVLLKHVFASIPPPDRLQFFKECLRCRRRLTQRWEDTPVASLFFSPKDLPFRTQVSALFFLQNSLEAMARKLLERSETELRGKECSFTLAERAKNIDSQIQQCNTELLSFAMPRRDSMDNSGEKMERADMKDASYVRLPISFLAAVLKKHFPKESSALHVQDIEEVLAYAARKNESTSSSSFDSLTVKEFYQLFPWIHPEKLSQEHEDFEAQLLNGANTSSENGSTGRGKKRSSEPWDCPTCTLHNEAAFITCSACGTRRPVADDAREEECDSTWACEACTFINESRRQPSCSICLTPNPNVLETSSSRGTAGSLSAAMMGVEPYCPEDHWVCSLEHGGCSKLNPKTEFYCTACEKSRPGLAHVRF